jgi:hypothetical protein
VTPWNGNAQGVAGSGLFMEVRWALRRRANRTIEELNTRLKLRIQPFKLTKRQVLIDRLVFDPEVRSDAGFKPSVAAKVNLRPAVIACDKREAFAQGSKATKQSIYPRGQIWIASLRSQRRGMNGAPSGLSGHRPGLHFLAKA